MFGGSYKARIEQIERDLDRLMNEVHKLSTALSTNSNTALLVRFNELEAALEALQKSNRREFGKLWKMGAFGEAPETEVPIDRDQLRRANAQSIMPVKPR